MAIKVDEKENNSKEHDMKDTKKINKKMLSEYDMSHSEASSSEKPYLQNRELSWLKFNERVLYQGNNKDNPLLERLNFTAIFSSNLEEFYMVRVGSITDLTLVKDKIIDNKSGMTPKEQINAINKECHRLLPIQEKTFNKINKELTKKGLSYLRSDEFCGKQLKYLNKYFENQVFPLLSPQVINARHPFPHLVNNAIYVVVELDCKDTTLGIIPLPDKCKRLIQLPDEDGIIKPSNTKYTLLEQLIKTKANEIFNMYEVKNANIISVTRNADLDVIEGNDEIGDDFREHMKRILKKRTRLAPVRLQTEEELPKTIKTLFKKCLCLRDDQIFTTTVPLDMSFCGKLKDLIPKKISSKLTYKPFTPQWPVGMNENKSVIKQILKRDYLLSYPYESFDVMVKLLREAATDPLVSSIRITLYRLSKVSRLAEALIEAAEAGKDVTTLIELRARFDEGNNIAWSQRFEEAGIKVLYGFESYKVHSKVCSIVRRKNNGDVEHICQFGTGNYHEGTSKLYTDFAYFTSNSTFGRDAEEFFRNMALENISDNYQLMRVAPLQIKQTIMYKLDQQIKFKKQERPCGIFFKTNSITDLTIINKIIEASQAGVPITILCRGICCIVPGIKGYTENIRVVSIVGRLLEHSRIYGFGQGDKMEIFLSSADLMTRNQDKRVEVAWPILNEDLKNSVLCYINTCLIDSAKLRTMLPNGDYTIPTGSFDAQEELIAQANYAKMHEAKDLYKLENEKIKNKGASKKKKKDKIEETKKEIQQEQQTEQQTKKKGIFARFIKYLNDKIND